jgi:hypothetical protein
MAIGLGADVEVDVGIGDFHQHQHHDDDDDDGNFDLGGGYDDDHDDGDETTLASSHGGMYGGMGLVEAARTVAKIDIKVKLVVMVIVKQASNG